LQHGKNWLRDEKLAAKVNKVNLIPLKIAAVEAALDRAASGWELGLIANI